MSKATALDGHSSVPLPSQDHHDRGYGASSTPRTQHLAPSTAATDFGNTPGQPSDSSPLSHSAAQQQNPGRFNEEWDASQRGSSIIDGPMQRSDSVMSQGETLIPSRGGTLKKKASMKRGASLKRSRSRRSSRAGSVRSLALQSSGDVDEMHSAFFSPVPTTGNPTEILANRFQAWRKVLKDLIQYFKSIQEQYEHRAKSLLKVSNVINNTSAPPSFLASGGIDDALQILRDYHKSCITEANKAKDIENDVILALSGLRSDLNQKIKEIKNLSGDFKNSVEKEMENTRRAVNSLTEGLGQSDMDPSAMTGKQDPYLLRLAVDRQIERQIDEENYLHQAYLNLEASGRELEAIVVGEIQKSYNALAGIIKREADGAYNAIEELRTGPIAMPKDHEWNVFVETDEHFVDPRIPVREPQNIHYPGRDSELASEVRAGLLERKSKYLKSYTPGWYVLSPTHLHEFKSADKTQAPIMSLYLPDQKLGSHSQAGASSNKFMLKGRQTGSLHRGHSWVFRAESYETMLAWYEDMKTLTEKSPQERNAFVRQHARSVSGNSTRSKAGSVSSDGDGMNDEDEEPFSATASSIAVQGPKQETLPRRPQPGGRFPSDLQVNAERGLLAPLSPSSGSSNFGDTKEHDVATGPDFHNSGIGQNYGGQASGTSPTHAARVNAQAQQDGINPYTYQPIQQSPTTAERHVSDGIDTSGLAAAGLGGAAIGIAGTEIYKNRPEDQFPSEEGAEAFPSYYEQQKQLATMESSNIAAPNTFEQEAQQQAAREATIIAAPSTSFQSGPDVLGMRSLEENRSVDTLSTDITIEQPTTSLSPPQNVPNTLDPVRPSMSPTAVSGTTISHLHIPGEFPKDPKRPVV
ncbi:PH domain-containing protein [Phlyctema vagabunda]|uniref:PH domain-containing protein n=1 Tax=Phlyctema vagabunda TaxID=108571 RepID=A0ABR4PS25_9HELO